jgi:hypothetical protein
MFFSHTYSGSAPAKKNPAPASQLGILDINIFTFGMINFYYSCLGIRIYFRSKEGHGHGHGDHGHGGHH